MSEHKIISRKNNVLLGREEVVFTVSSEKNPTKKEVVAILGKDETLSVVKQIRGSFGSNNFDVEVVIYNSKEAMDNIERPNRKTRLKMAEEAKIVIRNIRRF